MVSVMSSFLTDARVLTRVGIVELVAIEMYKSHKGREDVLPWGEVDSSERFFWRAEARKMYDEALLNFGT